MCKHIFFCLQDFVHPLLRWYARLDVPTLLVSRCLAARMTRLHGSTFSQLCVSDLPGSWVKRYDGNQRRKVVNLNLLFWSNHLLYRSCICRGSALVSPTFLFLRSLTLSCFLSSWSSLDIPARPGDTVLFVTEMFSTTHKFLPTSVTPRVFGSHERVSWRIQSVPATTVWSPCPPPHESFVWSQKSSKSWIRDPHTIGFLFFLPLDLQQWTTPHIVVRSNTCNPGLWLLSATSSYFPTVRSLPEKQKRDLTPRNSKITSTRRCVSSKMLFSFPPYGK